MTVEEPARFERQTECQQTTVPSRQLIGSIPIQYLLFNITRYYSYRIFKLNKLVVSLTKIHVMRVDIDNNILKMCHKVDCQVLGGCLGGGGNDRD